MARYCGAYPIDRACNPQDAVLGGGNDSLQKIVGKFMLGKLDRYETYGEDSKVALQVMMTDLTAAHRAEMAKRFYELGKKQDSLDPNSIGGKSTSGKARQLGSDAKSVLTDDANVATAVLGSYTTKCRILRTNPIGMQARTSIRNLCRFRPLRTMRLGAEHPPNGSFPGGWTTTESSPSVEPLTNRT
ncbi:hypothetical protein AB0E78_23145 [Streptomyces sp. NPDC032198]|uniref:hypothetical protein n=1 Tax=Streptomyces sp. NPDC032198 TaxID=3155127 RepID=UPI0033C925D2